MKILFVQKEGGIFGAENYQLNVIPALVERGVTVHFLRLYTDYQGGKGGDFIERLKQVPIETFEVNIGRFLSLGALLQIKKIIDKGGYDIIHSHLIHADFYIALVKALFRPRLKIVSTKHGFEEKYNNDHGFDPRYVRKNLYYRICRFTERKTDRSFAISNALRELFVKGGMSEEKKMGLIRYGFDLEDPVFDEDKSPYRKAPQQLIIVGRLVKFKGHRFALSALPGVIEHFPEVKLLFVGIGELEAELHQQVKELGLGSHVDFMGYSSRVYDFMHNSDIVLVPSISEGFGIVFLEAFNCQRPIIAFDVPAGNEIIEQGKSGVLVEPYDTGALSREIVALLKDKEKGDKMGKEGHRRMKQEFNLKRMVDETQCLYEQVNAT